MLPSSLVVIYVGSIFVELIIFMYVYMAINLFDYLTWYNFFPSTVCAFIHDNGQVERHYRNQWQIQSQEMKTL